MNNEPSLEDLGLDTPVKLVPPGKISIEELQRQSEREIDDRRLVVAQARESTMVIDLVAALLSLVLPGAGQILKGRLLRGLAWLLGLMVGYSLAGAAIAIIFPLGIALLLACLVLHVVCIADAIALRQDD